MNTIERQRFLTLIAFLDELPPEKFDFDVTVKEFDYDHCASIGCAIGWTPKIFPDLVFWSEQTVAMKDGKGRGFEKVAASLFGMGGCLADDFFSPEGQASIHDDLPECGTDATPKAVAAMMRTFLALVDAGEVEV